MSLGLCRVRESLTGNDLAGSDGSGKGSGNALQSGLGASAPEGPMRREGSEEGCTSQEHPKPPAGQLRAAASATPPPRSLQPLLGPRELLMPLRWLRQPPPCSSQCSSPALALTSCSRPMHRSWRARNCSR